MQKYISVILIAFTLSCKPIDIPLDISLDDPAYLVTNGGDNSISVVDPVSFKEKGRVYLDAPQNTFLHHININADHSKWLMAFPEFDFSGGHGGVHTLPVKGYVMVYNRKKAAVDMLIETPFANHNAFLTKDETEIWTSLVSHDGRVMVYDAQTGELIKRIQVNPDPHEIILTRDGKYALITAEESSFLSVIDIQTKTVIKDIKVDPLPTHVWHGWHDNQIIVENIHMKSINFVDLDKMAVVDYIDLDFVPGMAGFASENELWICAEKDHKLYIYEKDQGEWVVKDVLSTGQGPHYILFHNAKAFVVNQRQNTLEVYDVASRTKIADEVVGLKPNAIVYVQ